MHDVKKRTLNQWNEEQTYHNIRQQQKALTSTAPAPTCPCVMGLRHPGHAMTAQSIMEPNHIMPLITIKCILLTVLVSLLICWNGLLSCQILLVQEHNLREQDEDHVRMQCIHNSPYNKMLYWFVSSLYSQLSFDAHFATTSPQCRGAPGIHLVSTPCVDVPKFYTYFVMMKLDHKAFQEKNIPVGLWWFCASCRSIAQPYIFSWKASQLLIMVFSHVLLYTQGAFW